MHEKEKDMTTPLLIRFLGIRERDLLHDCYIIFLTYRLSYVLVGLLASSLLIQYRNIVPPDDVNHTEIHITAV